MRSSSGLRMYAIICSLPPPCLMEDETRCAVTVSVEDECHETYAERLSGGQKLLFPPNTMQFIIEALSDGKLVELSIGRYNATIVSTCFVKLYQEILDLDITHVECN
ncbi:MAG: hypothetical protein H0X51_04410 [Parachlamydiaceae bacterium]|nr:hypothetical protein [Parachlamydiaceae bacterium]